MIPKTDGVAGRRLLLTSACGLTSSLFDTITTALRAAMADAAATPGANFSMELLDMEVDSDYEVATYAS